MKTKTFITVLTLAFAVAAVPAFAQHGLGIGGAVASHTGISSSSSAATTAGAQAGAHAGAGNKTGANAQAGTSVQANTSASAKGGERHSDAGEHAGAGANIVTRIDRNPELVSKIDAMLPSGTTLSSAAAGFKNEGQFMAALEASHNLGISFSDLKAKMTGSSDMSLGAAIHASKPSMTEREANEAAKKAERDAKKAMADAKADARHADGDADDKVSTTASGSATTSTSTSTH